MDGGTKKEPSVCVRDALWILMPSQKCPWGVKEENIQAQHYITEERVKAIHSLAAALGVSACVGFSSLWRQNAFRACQ